MWVYLAPPTHRTSGSPLPFFGTEQFKKTPCMLTGNPLSENTIEQNTLSENTLSENTFSKIYFWKINFQKKRKILLENILGHHGYHGHRNHHGHHGYHSHQYPHLPVT